MYAQLKEDNKTSRGGAVSNASSSTSPSSTSQVSPTSSSSHPTNKLGTRGKNKNLDLQQSLMSDVEMNGGNGSLGSSTNGNGNGNTTINLRNGNHNVSIKNGSSSLMVSDDDPFYVFKEDLQIKLEMLDDGLQRFERIVQVTVSVFYTIYYIYIYITV